MSQHANDLRSILRECREFCLHNQRPNLAARIDRFISDPMTAVESAASRVSLTPVQRETLECVARYRSDHGVSPTFEELAAMRGRSKVNIYEILHALKRKGVIRMKPHAARSVQLVF